VSPTCAPATREYSAGLRMRSAAELSGDLLAGCASLGLLAADWSTRQFQPRDLATCERTIAGIQRLLVELRIAQLRPQ
jgi:hypothetical protein